MRLRISLFELLLLVTPACAIVLGLLTAAINSPQSPYVLTIAQSVYLAAMLAAVCVLFQRSVGARVFAGVFLGASLGHFLLVWLANQSGSGDAFPTTMLLAQIWAQAYPDAGAVLNSGDVVVSSGWTSYPPVSITGGPGYSGGIFPGGSTIPIVPWPVASQRPLFLDVGIWAVSLLLGVLCGVVARSLRGPDPEPGKTSAG